jgi:hypothetical protein
VEKSFIYGLNQDVKQHLNDVYDGSAGEYCRCEEKVRNDISLYRCYKSAVRHSDRSKRASKTELIDLVADE